MTTIEEQLERRRALRAANAAPLLRQEPRELKSDLKKGTAFAKKIRVYAAEQESAMMQEIKTYNLKMFIKETAQGVGAALFESPKPLKTHDLVSFTVLCSALHQRYEDFLPDALQSIKKAFDLTPMLQEMERKLDPMTPNVDLSRLKSAIRFLCEWWLVGLLPDAKFILGILQRVAMSLDAKSKVAEGGSTAESPAPPAHLTVNSLTVINLILRTVGIEMVGPGGPGIVSLAGHSAFTLAWSETEGRLVDVDEPTRIANEQQCAARRDDGAAKRGDYSTAAERSEFTKRVHAICDHAVKFVAQLKRGVESRWRQMCEQAELRGDPGQESKDAFLALRREAERCYVLAENLLATCGRSEDLPPRIDLAAAVQKSQVDSQLTFTSAATDFFNVKIAETMNYYDDDEARAFYEELPSIDHALLPIPEDDRKGLPATAQQLASRSGGGGASSGSQDIVGLEDEHDAAPDGLTRGAAALPASQRKLSDYSKIDELLLALHRCNSVSTVDAWVAEYLAEATKPFFRELPDGTREVARTSQAKNFFLNAKMMLLVELRYEPGRAQEMIPYLARTAAILHSQFPEMGEALSRQLENHVQDAVRNHRPNTFHSKQLNTRYLCELMKYRVCPPIRVLRVGHLAVDNFEDEACVHMCAIIVEHGASFLLRGGVVKAKTEELLQRMKQAAQSKGVPTKCETIYEHAWAELKRVMNPNRVRKVFARVRSPLEQYLHKLLFHLLRDDESSYLFVRSKVLKFPWLGNFPDEMPQEERRAIRYAMIRTFRKAHKIGYDHIPVLTELISDVTRVFGSACLLQPVVDDILEDFRRDLEIGSHRSLQKRLHDTKFLAELYNYRLVSLRVIAYVTLLLLVYCPTGPVAPADYSRLRCTLKLLRCSAPYFLKSGKAQSKQIMRKMLALLFVHMHARLKPMPLELDYNCEETLSEISQVYDDAVRRRNRRSHRHHHGDDDADTPGEDAFFLRTFPRTPKAALEYAEQVSCESVLEGNEYFDELCSALQHVERGSCLPVLSSSRSTSGKSALVRLPLGVPGNSAGKSSSATHSAASDSGSSDSSEESTSSSSESDEDSEGRGSSGEGSEENSESSGSNGEDGSDDEDDDEDEDEASSDSSSTASSSSSSSLSSEGARVAEPKLGPLANAHWLSRDPLPLPRGATNEEDSEFDAMFREVLKESSAEGARRSANRTLQQVEKLVESRLTSISAAVSSSSVVTRQAATETEAAMKVFLASHRQSLAENAAKHRKTTAGELGQPATEPTGAAEAIPAAVRVTVLRRNTQSQQVPQQQQPQQQSTPSSGSQATSKGAVEGRSVFVPLDSEFARRSQSFVEQAQRDKALIQERNTMMLRQHEEEEASRHRPFRGGRGALRQGGR